MFDYVLIRVPEEATKVWLDEVGLELPRPSLPENSRMKKIRQLTDVGRFLNRLLGKTLVVVASCNYFFPHKYFVVFLLYEYLVFVPVFSFFFFVLFSFVFRYHCIVSVHASLLLLVLSIILDFLLLCLFFFFFFCLEPANLGMYRVEDDIFERIGSGHFVVTDSVTCESFCCISSERYTVV